MNLLKSILHSIRHFLFLCPTEYVDEIMGGQFIRVRCKICGKIKVLG